MLSLTRIRRSFALRLAKHTTVDLLGFVLASTKVDLCHAPLWLQRLGTGSLAPSHKLKQLKKFITSLEVVPGDIVECGTYRGGTTAIMALQLKKLSSTKRVHSFDSFQGYPQPTAEDSDNSTKNFIHLRVFACTSYKLVSNKLKRLGIAEYVHLYKGFFRNSLHSLRAGSLSLVFLDCSLYQSYKDCLCLLYPKVTSGGIVIFDDYGSRANPGAARAVDEFFADKSESPQKIGFFWVVKKALI